MNARALLVVGLLAGSVFADPGSGLLGGLGLTEQPAAAVQPQPPATPAAQPVAPAEQPTASGLTAGAVPPPPTASSLLIAPKSKLVAAAPTTRPTAIKADANSVMIDKPEYCAKWLMPRELDLVNKGAGNLMLFRHQTTKGAPPHAIARVKFYPTYGEKTPLEKEVESAKASQVFIAKSYLRDEAITVGGHPAWVFVYDEPVEKYPKEVRPFGSTADGKPVPGRSMVVVGLYDDNRLTMEFMCPTAEFDQRVKMFQRALDSFTWAAPEQQMLTLGELKIPASTRWTPYKSHLFPSARTYRNNTVNLELSMYSTPMTAEQNDPMATVAAEQVAMGGKFNNAQFQIADAVMGDAKGKALIADYTTTGGCGSTLKHQVLHAVIQQSSRMYHVVLYGPPGSITKQHDMIEQMFAGLEFSGEPYKPKTPPALKADQKLVEMKAFSSQYAVSKDWPSRTKERGENLIEHRYDLPLNLGQGMKTTMPLEASFWKLGATDLDEQVRDAKSDAMRNEGVKFIKDAPATLGGRTAWVLVYDTPSSTKKGMGTRTMALVYYDADDGLIRFRFTAPQNEFDAKLKTLIQPVLNSFHWFDPE